MATLQRKLSVHFYHKFLKGIDHTEILSAMEKIVPREKIRSIQITEKEVIVSVADIDSKLQLLVRGIKVKDRAVTLFEVEKTITNVTIKDVPYEMADNVVATHVSRFGDVVHNSMKRGTIKGTAIQTGTRYVQLLNATPLIPISTQFGSYDVRLFADNNRTPCYHYQSTDHMSYRCPNKPEKKNVCYRCKRSDHLIRDCPEPDTCYKC